MKKWFYIVTLVAAAALAGCTKSEVTAPASKAVTFQVGSYAPQTKADEEKSIIAVDNIKSFKSRGFLHAEGVTGAQDFFGANGETITYNNSNAWLPSHDYYWPKSANSYVNFISWVGGTPAISYTQSSDTGKWGATFAWNGVTVGQNDNLLWADMAWHYNENVVKNDAGDNGYWFDNVTEGVPTLFHHALAQIRFLGKLAKAEDSPTKVAWEVNVTKLSLTGVYKTGSFSLTNVDPATKKTEAWTIASDWTTSGTPANIETTGNYPITYKESATAEGDEIIGWYCVIPQATNATTGAGVKNLTVEFTVKTTYTTSSTTSKVVEEKVSKTINLTAFDNAPTTWARGTRYTYTLVINPDTGIITIIPVETDWNGPVEIPGSGEDAFIIQ